MARKSPRNWDEDASHENGNYECICVVCGNRFIGHKRRIVCKICDAIRKIPITESELAAWNSPARRAHEE